MSRDVHGIDPAGIIVACIMVAVVVTGVGPFGSVHAATPVQIHRTQERRATEEIAALRARDRRIRRHWHEIARRLRQARWVAVGHPRRPGRSVHRLVGALRDRRARLRSWLDTWAIFEVCPVLGSHEVMDDFGTMVRLPDVPVHRHLGNDIAAATGTPIVAPFDGTATTAHGTLGGLQVRVAGALGFVGNAHLSGYAKTGAVDAGDVIGYVGSTGDATAPHVHMEWHPDGGEAVDPNPFLNASCG